MIKNNLHKLFYNLSNKKKLKYNLSSFFQSKIVKNLFFSSFGLLLLQGVRIFSTPITTRILSPEDYGVSALAGSFATVLAVILGLGLRVFFSMEYFHLDSIKKKITLNNIILLYLVFSLPVTILFCLFPSPINKIIFSNKAPNLLIIFATLYTFLGFFTELFFNTLSYQKKISRMTTIQICAAIITIALSLIFLCSLKWGVVSLMASQLIGTTIVCFIGIREYLRTCCHKYVIPKEFSSSYKTYLKTSLAFVPGLMCAWMLSSADRWLLAKYNGMHDTGIYSIAATFAQLFQIGILLPMRRAYMPAVLEKFAKNKNDLASVEKWNKRNMLFTMIALFGIISVGFFIAKPILRIILPPSFHPAISYIWLILVGQIFLLGEHFSSLLITFHKRVRFHAVSLFIPATLNIVLNIILIPYLNITGCILATVISYVVYFLSKFFYNLHLQKNSAENFEQKPNL